MMTLVGRPTPEQSRGSHFSYVDKDATTMKPTCNNPSTSNDPTAGITIQPDQYQSCIYEM